MYKKVLNLFIFICIFLVYASFVNASSVSDTLLEGNTKTYTLDSKNYTITLDFVDSNSAKFTINGESTEDLLEGETDTLADETRINVTDILYQDYAGGVHSASFTLTSPPPISIINILDFGVDTDGDGLYNYLIIKVKLNVSEAGEYEIYTELENSLDNEIDWIGDDEFEFNAGENTIQLNFSGIDIYKNGVDGPYELTELYIQGDDFDLNFNDLYNTSAYRYIDFQRPGANFTGVFSDYGYDANGNGLYDYLIVEVGININRAGNYEIEGQLEDQFGHEIEDDVETESYFEVGTHNVHLNFSGNEIYTHEVYGPYTLTVWLDDKDDDVDLDSLRDAYNTSNYNYTSFEHEIIDTTPPNITITSPINGSTITTSLTWLNVTTDEPTYCWVNDLYNYPTNDKIPPEVYDASPTGTVENCCSYDLSFKTNEESACKGSANIDASYEDMSFTFNSEEISSTEYIHTYHTNLKGTNTIFAKCRDLAGNINPISYNWSFEQICSNQGGACGGGGGEGIISPIEINYTNLHQWQYTNLTNKYTYVIEVKCRDRSYNSNTESVAFNVDLKPIANTFDGETIDFSALNEGELANISNVVLEKTSYGKIDFGSIVLDLRGALDLDAYVKISDNFIGIDTTNLPALNKPATLTMKGLNYDKTPIIYYYEGFSVFDDTVCPSTLCSNINYNASTGTLTFDVAHFTGFWTGENSTNKLRISGLDVNVAGKSDNNLADNSKISEEAKPESNVEFKIKIKNLYTKEENVEIKDIEVEVTIEDIDDGNDLEGDADEFDLEAGDDETVKINLKIPLEVDEKTYGVIMTVNGEDENGKEHKVEWNLQLEVDKEKLNVVINEFNVNPSIISCDRDIRLNTELINLGSEDQEDVALEILNSDLGLNINEKDIKLDEGTDDNKFKKSFTLKISDDVPSGIYPISINSYYDNNELSDSKSIDLVIQDCEMVQDVKEEVKEKKPIVEAKKFAPIEKQVAVAPTTITSFADISEYITLLIILNVIITGLIIFTIGYLFIKRK